MCSKHISYCFVDVEKSLRRKDIYNAIRKLGKAHVSRVAMDHLRIRMKRLWLVSKKPPEPIGFQRSG